MVGENRWCIVGDNTRYIVAANYWCILGENTWYIMHRKMRVEEEQEIWGYLSQSNISARNLSRLKTLAVSPNEEIARRARLALEIGCAHPQKRNRLRFLARERKDLFEQLEETGLIFACTSF